MNKESFDSTELYEDLQNRLAPKLRYKLSDVKDQIRRVAFDVVQFKSSDRIDDLWMVQRDGDDEYIVAMYGDEIKTASSKAPESAWQTSLDASERNVTVFYKGAAVKRISLQDLGIPAEDAYLVRRSLQDKLANDQQFTALFINELDEETKKELTEAGQ